jgi:iron complex transport system substrate-binding protein
MNMPMSAKSHAFLRRGGFFWVVIAGLLVCFPAAGFGQKKAIKDLVGRTVMVPVAPRRVVALAPSVTEIIYALAAEEKLVGATRFSDYPEPARRLPKVGSYVHLDLERIVALDPDLCIAVKDGNPRHVVSKLEALGISVFAVNPVDLGSVMETITAIGGLIGEKQAASRVVGDMVRRIAAVRQALADITVRPRVFFQIGIDPIVSAGSDTFIDELIAGAGGENLAAGGVPYPRFSREQVLDLKPDVIVITSMARHAVFEKVKAYWQQWPGMPAVRNERIFLQESNIYDRPTPRMVSGLESLARILHPDRFEEDP